MNLFLSKVKTRPEKKWVIINQIDANTRGGGKNLSVESTLCMQWAGFSLVGGSPIMTLSPELQPCPPSKIS